MYLQAAIKNSFVQLTESFRLLTPQQYTAKSTVLFGATIGQHVRHIIELFQELEKGYQTGVVNYEQRKRDYTIETDKELAASLLHNLYAAIERPDKPLLLEANYSDDATDVLTIPTNYYREVIYNLEHTVHHMALIRVGINEMGAVALPEGYGVATSTLKYRKACAQ